VLVFSGMTSAYLAESCQGDRTQGQQSVLLELKSIVEVHSVWHNIYVAGRCGLLLRVPAKERGTYVAMHKYYHKKFSAISNTANLQMRRVCCIYLFAV
jgi:hypothetical protein